MDMTNLVSALCDCANAHKIISPIAVLHTYSILLSDGFVTVKQFVFNSKAVPQLSAYAKQSQWYYVRGRLLHTNENCDVTSHLDRVC